MIKFDGCYTLKIAIGIMMLPLLPVDVAGAMTISVNASGGSDFTQIQDAINAATPGDRIEVYSGTYYENVNLSKQLILSGIGMPVVDANGSSNAITLSANGVVLDGFRVTNSAYINNSILDNAGIKVTSNNNIVKNNTVFNNFHGIYIYHSTNNTLMNNQMYNNKYNFGLVGWNYSSLNNSIDHSNFVDGRPIFYIVGLSDFVINSSSNAGTFYCIGCVNITIKDLNLTNNNYGIYFYNATNLRIQNNHVSNNKYGIYLISGYSNSIEKCEFCHKEPQDLIPHVNGGKLCLNCHGKNPIHNIHNESGIIKLDCDMCHGFPLKNVTVNPDGSPGNYIICEACHAEQPDISQPSYGNLIEIHLSRGTYCINCHIVDIQVIHGKGVGNTNSNLIRNNVGNNNYGISIYSSRNIVYHNNFVNNKIYNALDITDSKWNAYYPSGGNYWSDYTGVDLKSGSNQNLPGADDIGDTLYNISGDTGAHDRYPFMQMNGWLYSVIPFPDTGKTPTDPDDDGLYEDINGNGRKDFNDVIGFFNYLEWVEINEPLSNFDFNGNGRIDFSDIIKLFDEM